MKATLDAKIVCEIMNSDNLVIKRTNIHGASFQRLAHSNVECIAFAEWDN